MTGKIMPLRERDTSTVQAAADAFLSSPRYANPNTRRGYDRARILFTRHTGWELHQLRHSAATHLGEQGIPLQLIMAKTGTATRVPRCGTSAQAPKPSLRSPPCSNLHVDEAEQYLPTLRAGDSFRSL